MESDRKSLKATIENKFLMSGLDLNYTIPGQLLCIRSFAALKTGRLPASGILATVYLILWRVGLLISLRRRALGREYVNHVN